MVIRKDVLLLFSSVTLVILCFTLYQYIVVTRNSSNSSGIGLYLLSIPIQVFGLSRFFFWQTIRPKKPNKIHICFTRENTTANLLYSNFGFVDGGLDEHGQINLILQT